MGLFRRKQQTNLISRALPLLGRWITPAGIRFQTWAEPRLNRIERQLSRRQKILFVTLFCLAAGGYSTTLLVSALIRPAGRSVDFLTPTTVSRPLTLPHRDSVLRLRRSLSAADSSAQSSPVNK